jgi:hypothetical protein
MRRALALALALSTSCSDDEPPLPPLGEWLGLLSGNWSLAPGEEKYVCVRATLSHDIHVARFRPEAGVGTHHTLLTVTSDAEPDGVSDCDGYENGQVALFASGYGTEELALPPGVAVRVGAGTKLLLNVHLLNTTTEAQAGATGTSVFLVDAGEVVERAEVFLAGKVDDLEVIPGESTQRGTCTFAAASNVYAIMPHMHARGSHIAVAARRAAGDATLLDEPFDVDDQRYRVTDPATPMAAGDRLEVTCTYQNTTPITYGFGPLSSDEMCYAITLRYPALGGSPLCDE